MEEQAIGLIETIDRGHMSAAGKSGH
jgi:hypothetical protein